MFIKRTTKHAKGKTYLNHLLVESMATPSGPRPRVICSLGSLAPAPEKEWLALARKIENALTGQKSFEPDARVESAFRAMKSPLSERPIFHHLVEHRVQTHIFLCVLAYHLLNIGSRQKSKLHSPV